MSRSGHWLLKDTDKQSPTKLAPILTKQQEDPPEPVLTIEVASEVVRELESKENICQIIQRCF